MTSLMRSYLVGSAWAPLKFDDGGIGIQISRLLEELLDSSQIRASDVYDCVIGRVPDGADDVLSELSRIPVNGIHVTAQYVYRGVASGLQALTTAARTVHGGEEDVVVAIALDPPFTEPHLVSSGAKTVDRECTRSVANVGLRSETHGSATVGSFERVVTGWVVANNRYLERAKAITPKARVRRSASAAAHDASFLADGPVEATVRLLMNETVNVDDIDVWHIAQFESDLAADFCCRLGIDIKRLMAGLSAPCTGSGTSLRTICTMVDQLAIQRFRSGIAAAPGPGSSGLAVLIERSDECL